MAYQETSFDDNVDMLDHDKREESYPSLPPFIGMAPITRTCGANYQCQALTPCGSTRCRYLVTFLQNHQAPDSWQPVPMEID
jgi:hypothetical protein